MNKNYKQKKIKPKQRKGDKMDNLTKQDQLAILNLLDWKRRYKISLKEKGH